MLEGFNEQQKNEIEQFVAYRISILAIELLQDRDRILETVTSGGNSSVVKPDTPTTQQSIPETGTTELSSLISELGDLLAEVDTQMNSLMRLKNTLLSFFNKNLAGAVGRNVPDSLASDEEYDCPHPACKLGKDHATDHFDGVRYF